MWNSRFSIFFCPGMNDMITVPGGVVGVHVGELQQGRDDDV